MLLILPIADSLTKKLAYWEHCEQGRVNTKFSFSVVNEYKMFYLISKKSRLFEQNAMEIKSKILCTIAMLEIAETHKNIVKNLGMKNEDK